MAADEEQNEQAAGGNPLASLGTGAKALGDLAAGAGSAISAIPLPTGKDSGKALGLCCGCGCLALVLVIGLLVAFAVGGNFIGARSAEPPPDARAGQSGRGDGDNVTGGTRQGQIDPSQTSGDCAELRGAFAGTDTAIIPIINEAAARWEVSAALVAAVAKQESGFNPFATNPVSGAQGLMQIVPDTWGDLYDPADGLPNNPYDARASAFYGAKYLSQQRDTFGDRVDLIAAAYNAGPGNVQAYGGIPPFIETQNYVRAVTAFYNAYLDCLTAESRPNLSGGGAISESATADERKVIETARDYHGEACSGIDCYQHTVAVYKLAGMRPEAVGLDQWDGRISVSPRPGYIMNLDVNHDGTADHTVLFDHEETTTYDGREIRVWYYWHADATNAWVYTSDSYDPATAFGSRSRTLPWSPDIDGLPVHMWRPIPE